MTKTETATYRHQLLKLERHLRGDVETLEDEAFHKSDGKPFDNLSNVSVEDRAERTTDNNIEEVAISLFVNANGHLGEISSALERIDKGTFGKCEECAQQISKERLHTIPFARLCIDCGHKAQQGELASRENL